MSSDPKKLKFSVLRADPLNPRINSRNTSDLTNDEAMRRLVMRNPKELVTLAEDVAKNGLVPSQQPIVLRINQSSKNYYLLDGNRRFTAINLLQSTQFSESLGLASSLLKRLDKARKNWQPVKFIWVVEVESREAGNVWLQRIHRGKAGGAGLTQWEREDQLRYDQLQDGKENITLTIIDWMLANGQKQETDSFSILERFLSSSEAKTLLGLELDDNTLKTTLYGSDAFSLMKKVYALIQSKNWNTRTLNTAENIRLRIDKDLLPDFPIPFRKRPKAIPLSYLEHDDAYQNEHILVDESRVQLNTIANNNSSICDGSTSSQTSIILSEKTDLAAKNESKSSSRKAINVIPSKTSIRITENRPKEIFNCLRQMRAKTYPLVAAIALRTLIEDTVYFYCAKTSFSFSEKKLKVDRSHGLHSKMSEIAERLESSGLTQGFDEKQKEALKQLDIISSLNAAVHNPYHNVTEQMVQGYWSIVESFIQGCWNEINDAKSKSS